jgi:hypothetical protein
MRVIDANTGITVNVGDTFHNVDGVQTLLRVEERMFRAHGLFRRNGSIQWVPLQVRYTHPGFFLQKVAFIPS